MMNHKEYPTKQKNKHLIMIENYPVHYSKIQNWVDTKKLKLGTVPFDYWIFFFFSLFT